MDRVYSYYRTTNEKQLKKQLKQIKKDSAMVSINALSNKRPITWSKKPRLWGNALINSGLIPVDCSSLLGAGRIIPVCVKKLEEGQNVAIFFQGTIMDLDKTTPETIKGGASTIAYKAKVNVLPLYIQEFDYHKLTKHGRFPRLFSEYKIIVGDEIPVEETDKPTREQCSQLDQKVLAAIKDLKHNYGGANK